MEYLHTLENKYSKSYSKIKIENYHPQISEFQRQILVQWMHNFCQQGRFKASVLFLAVELMDQYFARTKVCISEANYQQIGVCCIFLAFKLEEDDVNKNFTFEVCRMALGSCNKKEFQDIEADILFTLDFELNIPTIYTYIQKYLHSIGNTGKEF